ncbi:MAG: TPM domain-containing protein, partial [Terriglobales bacterium]
MKFPQSIRVAIILLALPLLLAAEPVSQLRPADYVNDFAHVLDQTTIAQLDNICQQLDQKAHAQIAVVTVNSLDGSDIESYAVALYKQWGIGSKATDHGVLILLAVQDHKYRIEVGYGLEPILPDGKVGGFGREAVPLLRQNDYNGAVSLMTSRVADVIAQDAGIQLTGDRPQFTSQPEGGPERGLSGKQLLILGIILLIVLLTPLRSVLFWILLSGLGGGGGGYRGGGGGFGG